MGSGNQGVLTIRGAFSSIYPKAPSTIYPTQSMRRTLNVVLASSFTSTASFGTNFGSVVMTVFPDALCGSSSMERALSYSLPIFGKTRDSINRLINVDLPVRTGPTTPI
jgi:hypothetical protein